MSSIGAFALVLHGHLPYMRQVGSWPYGEEWIHETLAETYIPLLNVLYDLREEGVAYQLTLGLSPVLVEQFADPLILEHFDRYIEERIGAAQQDKALYAGQGFYGSTLNGAPDLHLRYLAEWYESFYQRIQHTFHARFRRDLISALRSLQDTGHIELMSSAATHGYLPLFKHDSSIYAQLSTGLISHERWFGQRPTALWLPEYAYRPGLEQLMDEQGLRVFFIETHTLVGGEPVGAASGKIIGPYGEVKRRYALPQINTLPQQAHSLFKAYYVQRPDGTPTQVAVLARNDRTSEQVWSSEWGYPGDFDYREFHKRAGTSGLQYWRVTGAKTALDHKDFYHPDWAGFKVEQHAEHFAHFIGDTLRHHNNHTGHEGVILASLDVRLLGHWWFEGIPWLKKVLRHIAGDPEIALVTVSQQVEAQPPSAAVALPESSWGPGGGHFAWNNGDNRWLWPLLHEAEARMETLATRFDRDEVDESRIIVLNQMARELLLAQSSDWAFLIATGQGREYAAQRFNQHMQRFDQLALGVEHGQPSRELADAYYSLDRVFPDLDYRWFRRR